MHVTFPRLPDHERGYAVVERDDGVVYQLYGDMAGPRLPHDIRHLVVEGRLGITDGIWGGIAAGVVFGSMRHVSGRRPPRAADRSRTLLRNFREQGLRAELIAVLVESVAALDDPSPDQVRRLARAKLAVLPDPDVDPVAIAAAAQALQVEAARWARLRVGEALSYDWPPRHLAQCTACAVVPRIVRAQEKRNRRRPPGRLARLPGQVLTWTGAQSRQVRGRPGRAQPDTGGRRLPPPPPPGSGP
jgi:hypothetical protein